MFTFSSYTPYYIIVLFIKFESLITTAKDAYSFGKK